MSAQLPPGPVARPGQLDSIAIAGDVTELRLDDQFFADAQAADAVEHRCIEQQDLMQQPDRNDRPAQPCALVVAQPPVPMCLGPHGEGSLLNRHRHGT